MYKRKCIREIVLGFVSCSNNIIYIYTIIIIIKEYPQQAVLEALYCFMGMIGEEEREKNRKVEVKRKWLGLPQPLYSLQGNDRQSPGWKPKGDNASTQCN